MPEDGSASIDAKELCRMTCQEAQTLVDEHLGLPKDWDRSALLKYRLLSDFQSTWKTEVGHWLSVAKRFGFLEEIKKPLLGERNKSSRANERDLHDSRHLKWHQRLAEALFCHYFTSDVVGWCFEGWETETGGRIDIDLALRAPDKTHVEFQVKAPDRPGKIIEGHCGKRYDKCHGKCGNQEQGRYVPCLGDCDKNVLQSVCSAFEQLPNPPRSVAMVGVFAQRQFSLAAHPGCLIRHLFGRTIQTSDQDVHLPSTSLGRFLLGQLNHVSGVIIIDMIPSLDPFSGNRTATYPCTVLLNPNATYPARPEWFPRSQVLVLEEDVFRWVGGELGNYSGLPTGTCIGEPGE